MHRRRNRGRAFSIHTCMQFTMYGVRTPSMHAIHIRTCSIVRGRLQRSYHACIRRVTRPQAYWPCQHRPQAYRLCQYAPAQHHDRWPARDQGCHGRTSRDTPTNRSSRSRHNDAELSLRGKRSNRVVHGPLSPSTGMKRFSSRKTMAREARSRIFLTRKKKTLAGI